MMEGLLSDVLVTSPGTAALIIIIWLLWKERKANGRVSTDTARILGKIETVHEHLRHHESDEAKVFHELKEYMHKQTIILENLAEMTKEVNKTAMEIKYTGGSNRGSTR
jgi:hypothetical protein